MNIGPSDALLVTIHQDADEMTERKICRQTNLFFFTFNSQRGYVDTQLVDSINNYRIEVRHDPELFLLQR